MSGPDQPPAPAPTGGDPGCAPPLLVFVSYSRKQLDQARHFVRRLRDMGLRTWHDVEDIPVGTTWDSELDRGLRECDAVIGLLTPDSVVSKYVLDEFAAAEAYGKALILVVLEPAIPPTRFIRLQQLFYDPEHDDAFFEGLGREIERLRVRVAAERAKADPRRGPAAAGSDGGRAVTPFRSFQTAMRQVAWMEAGPGGTLWVSDDEIVKAFLPNQATATHRSLLPEEAWKKVFPLIWRDGLVCADWRGGLQAFDLRIGGAARMLREPAFADQPVHLLARDPAGALWAACWDGRVMGWSAEGEPLCQATVPHLPRQLLPLPGWGVAVVDDAGIVHGIALTGDGFQWRSPQPVVAAWGSNVERPDPVLFVLTAGDQLIEVRGRPLTSRAVTLPGRPTAWAHRLDPPGDEWTALALASGSLAWFSWRSRRVSTSTSVGLPFAVRQIVAVGDPHNPTALCAVGVTADREVFTVRDQQVRRTGVGPVEALALDASGTFLFCRNGGGVEAYRNPVLERAEASIRIEGVTGRLEVGAYQELGLRVVNDGPIVIRSLRLVLEGTGRIEKVQRRFEHRLAPGEGLDLQLGAKALVRGSKVPLDVHVELEDEAGPPASVRSFTVEVAVDGA